MGKPLETLGFKGFEVDDTGLEPVTSTISTEGAIL